MTAKPAPQPSAGGRAGMKKELPERFRSYKHVWVFVELERGVVHPVSWELMGEGRKLADKLGVQLAGVVLGGPDQGTREAVADAYAYGADVAYLVETPVLTDYRNEPYTRCMTELVNTYQPEILLLGATTLGRDLAGAVATTLMTGLTADCTELAVDADGSLAATRPTFGGSLLCTIYTLNFRPQMATVRPRVFSLPERQEGRSGPVIEHDFRMLEEDIVTKILQFIPDRDFEQVEPRLCRYRGGGRPWPWQRGKLSTRQGPRQSLAGRVGRFAPAGAARLDPCRPPDWPDRQDHPPEALHRGRNFRRHPASRGRRGRGFDPGDQHRQERAHFRLRPCGPHHGRGEVPACAVQGGAQADLAQYPLAACRLKRGFRF